jgi:hypothetical protein
MTLTLYGVTSDGTSVPIEVTDDGKLVVDTSGSDNFVSQGDDVEFGTGDFTGDLTIGDDPTAGVDKGVKAYVGGALYVTNPKGTSPVFEGRTKGTEEATSSITADGEAKFGKTTFTNEIVIGTRDNQGVLMTTSSAAEGWNSGSKKWSLGSSGDCTFYGTVVIGSRSKLWEIRESNGVAMLIERTRRATADLLNGDSDELSDNSDVSTDVKVRDLPNELDLVEAALNEVMSRLKMVPPAGWPVWDGQSEVTTDNDIA